MSDLRLGIAWFTFGLAWLTVGWGRFTVWHGQVYRWPGLNKPHEHGLIIRTLIMTPHPLWWTGCAAAGDRSRWLVREAELLGGSRQASKLLKFCLAMV